MAPISADPLHSDHRSLQNSPNTRTSPPRDCNPPVPMAVSQILGCHTHTGPPPYEKRPTASRPVPSAASGQTDRQRPFHLVRSRSPPTHNSAGRRSRHGIISPAIPPPPNHCPRDTTSALRPPPIHIL